MNLPWEVLGSGGAGFLFGIGVHIGATRAALRGLVSAVTDLKKQVEKNEDARNRQCQAHWALIREIELDVAHFRGTRGLTRTEPPDKILRAGQLEVSGSADV